MIKSLQPPIILLLFMVSNLGFAQDKILTTEDAIYMNRAIYPASVPQLQWIGSTNYYAYAKANSIYKVGAKTGTETLLFDVEMLNNAMVNKGYDSIRTLPRVTIYGDNNCRFSR